MFESIILQKTKDIENQISFKNDIYYLFELMFNPNIEQAYKTYFSAEVDWWIYEERQYLEANERFNLNDPKLGAFLSNYNDLLKKNAYFSKKSLMQCLNDAILARLNILIRPRLALKWFIFRWEQSRPYHEIIKRFNYIDDYHYLENDFKNYVNSNKIIEKQDDLISAYKFERIIAEIDNQYISTLSPQDFLNLINPIFEFFNKKTKISNTEKIPIEPIIIFLNDKNMTILSNLLENSYKNGELINISKKYLLGFIYKTLFDLDNIYGESDDLLTNINEEIKDSQNINIEEFNISNSFAKFDDLANHNEDIDNEGIDKEDIDNDNPINNISENSIISNEINEEEPINSLENIISEDDIIAEENQNIIQEEVIEPHNINIENNTDEVNAESNDEEKAQNFNFIMNILSQYNDDEKNIQEIEKAVKDKNQNLINSLSHFTI